MIDVSDRHPATQHLSKMLTPNPNLKPDQHSIAVWFADFVSDIIDTVPDGPELTAGLRKLLEAKDCVIRASLDKK